MSAFLIINADIRFGIRTSAFIYPNALTLMLLYLCHRNPELIYTILKMFKILN